MSETTYLARERTRLASERTLMAWTRTAASLIGFGFSIPKFLGLLVRSESLAGTPGVSPRLLGILLIGLGTLGVLGGLVEHARLLQRIGPALQARQLASTAFIIATLIGLVGFVAFFNVLLM